ncbi:hypothetical protein LEP1GSC150_2389, partial [Leptospira interrogans serovar Copenhageni str. LT2050]
MLISPDSFPFWIILGFGSLGAASLGSFYVTLGFRILETYYGKQRKSLTFFQNGNGFSHFPAPVTIVEKNTLSGITSNHRFF